jgi:histidine ammonia-lyase
MQTIAEAGWVVKPEGPPSKLVPVSTAPPPLALTGHDLGPAGVVAVARLGRAVEIAPAGRARIEAGGAALEQALADGRPMYGLTTGLGARVGEALPPTDPAELSARIVRGRATAVGEPLPEAAVRAAMVVRLNGLCAGGAGVTAGAADTIAAMLNAGVHPVIPRTGSIGAGDLCLLAHLGLVLLGEGEAVVAGERLGGAEALRRAGIPVPRLGPRDGLAVCNASAVSAGVAALAAEAAGNLLEAVQIAAALSMEGFRASTTPIDAAVAGAHPAPGQEWEAAGLRQLLAGGSLLEEGGARRLQDPLSFRCASHVHGSMRLALDVLAGAIRPELNGAGDNPVVLADGRVVSTGNFHTPALALALDAAAIAVAQVAAPAAERPARLATERLSGLAGNLTGSEGRSGVAPLLKTAQALAVEIRHLAAPLALDPRFGADGVEDDSTNAAQAALRLDAQLALLGRLVALELVCAAQAVDLAGPERLGRGTAAAHACVRELVQPLHDDRPLGADVERVAGELVGSGLLVGRVREAVW